MKKLFSLLAAILLLGGFLLPAGLSAGDGSVLDQSYAVVSSNGYGYQRVGVSGAAQTFRPTKNRISAIDVSFDHRQTGTSITMTVKNGTTNQVIGTETHALTFAGDTAWETFTFQPNLTVVPDGRYRIELSSGDGSDNDTYWRMSNLAPRYDRGFATSAGSTIDFDMLFNQYGKDVAETVPAVTGDAKVAGETGTKTEVDESIKEPVVTYVMKNKTKIMPPFEKEIAVGKTSSLDVYGTSFKGAKVVVFIDEKGYTAVTDADGNWNLPLALAGLEAKTYTVTAQAQNIAGKGSKVVEVLKAKVVAPVASEKVASSKSWFAGWNVFYILLPVGLLLFVLLLLALIARRHHREVHGEKKEKEKAVESESEEPKAKEVKIKK